MKGYLIEFRYEYYCQGYEWTTAVRLVYAASYEDARARIKFNEYDYYNACDFKNRTME